MSWDSDTLRIPATAYAQTLAAIPHGHMIKKIKEKIDSWDLKTVFQTSIALAVIFFIVFYLLTMRDRIRQEDEKEFKGQTTGQIISVTPKEMMSQTKSRGTEIYVDSYDVLYEYKVNGQLYQQTDNIPLTASNQKLLKKILKRSDETLLVAFDLNNPKKSILVESK